MSLLAPLLSGLLAVLAPALASADPIGAALAVADQVAGSDPHLLRRAAVEGIAQELDALTGVPCHEVFSEVEWAQREAWRHGAREGVAVEYGLVHGRGIIVTDVYPDGPADRAGLMRGDLIVGVDRQPLTGLDAEAIHRTVQGAQHAQVVLDVRRAGELHTIHVDRGEWHSGLVRLFPVTGGVVLRIPFFGDGSAKALEKALLALPPDSGLVIDLRNNQGGMLQEAVDAADLFLAKGEVIVHVDGAGGTVTPMVARTTPVWPGRAVIIVNQATAAEAEAFTAALRSRENTPVVGTWSAGRADLPEGRKLGEDLVLQVIGQTMRDPLGRSWAGTGLQPDVLSTPIDLVLPAGPGQLPPDLQREAALQVIRSH